MNIVKVYTPRRSQDRTLWETGFHGRQAEVIAVDRNKL